MHLSPIYLILESPQEDFNQELISLLKEEDKSRKPDGIDGFGCVIADTLRQIKDTKDRLRIQGKLLLYLNELILELEQL